MEQGRKGGGEGQPFWPFWPFRVESAQPRVGLDTTCPSIGGLLDERRTTPGKPTYYVHMYIRPVHT